MNLAPAESRRFSHVGLPSDEQTRAIKQRENRSPIYTSMTMMHFYEERVALPSGTR